MVARPLHAAADAHQRRLLPEFLEIHARQSLAETFGDTIQTVRPHRGLDVDMLVLPVEADRMIGAGKQNARHAMGTGCLVEIIEPEQIGIEDLGKLVLDRDTAEMNDAIAAFDELHHRIGIAEIAGDKLLMGGSLAEIDDVGQAHRLGKPAHARPHGPPQPAGGAGYQKPFHAIPPKA